MPTKKVPPTMAFAVYDGLWDRRRRKIFHVYEDGEFEGQCDFIYSTDMLERVNFEFDIQDVEDALKEKMTDEDWKKVKRYGIVDPFSEHSTILQKAVELGVVTFVDGEHGVDDEPVSIAINGKLQDSFSKEIEWRNRVMVK